MKKDKEPGSVGMGKCRHIWHEVEECYTPNNETHQCRFCGELSFGNNTEGTITEGTSKMAANAEKEIYERNSAFAEKVFPRLAQGGGGKDKMKMRIIRPETVEKLLEETRSERVSRMVVDDRSFNQGVIFACKQLLEFGVESVEEKSCKGCKWEDSDERRYVKDCYRCGRNYKDFYKVADSSVGNEGAGGDLASQTKPVSSEARQPSSTPAKPELPQKVEKICGLEGTYIKGLPIVPVVNSLIDFCAYLEKEVERLGRKSDEIRP